MNFRVCKDPIHSCSLVADVIDVVNTLQLGAHEWSTKVGTKRYSKQNIVRVVYVPFYSVWISVCVTGLLGGGTCQ